MKIDNLNMKAFLVFLITALVILTNVNHSFAQSSNSSDKKNKNNLQISQPSTLIVTSVCPGCVKSWSDGNVCLEWDVTTTKSEQKFQVFFQNPSNASDLNLDWVWMYQDDLSGNWKNFNNNKNLINKERATLSYRKLAVLNKQNHYKLYKDKILIIILIILASINQ